MGKIASGNTFIGAVVRREIVAEIDRRREGQSMTRSKFISLILARWLAEGCPPVNDADRAIIVLHGKPKKRGNAA